MKVCRRQPKKPYYRVGGGIVFTESPPRMKEKGRVVRCVSSDEQMRQAKVLIFPFGLGYDYYTEIHAVQKN